MHAMMGRGSVCWPPGRGLACQAMPWQTALRLLPPTLHACASLADACCCLCVQVFVHIPMPYQAHHELFRILKPGGSHVFTVPFSPVRASWG